MKTIDIEIGMMNYFYNSRNITVPNVYWGIPGLDYECDLVSLTTSDYATEIEIKISKQDLKRDRQKSHHHKSNLFKYFYFAVPEALQEFALEEIPERAGLFIVKKNDDVIKIKKAAINKNCRKWTDYERFKLAYLGSMRILNFKRKIRDKENEYKAMETTP